MEQASQKRSREDKLRDHLLKAQEEFRVAKDAVCRAQREIDTMPSAPLPVSFGKLPELDQPRLFRM